jgi:hypothetical protein
VDFLSKEKQYELDTRLYEQANALNQLQNKLITDYTTVDANGNNPYQQDPSAYRNYVQKALGDWRNNAAKAGNNSQYYNDQLQRMDLQGKAAMEQRVYAAEAQTAIQRAQVNLQTRLTMALNSDADYETKTQDALNFINEAKGLNILNPIEEADAIQSVHATVLKQQLAMPDDYSGRTSDWNDWMDQINTNEEYKKTIPNFNEAVENARSGGIAQIQRRNLVGLSNADDQYQALMKDFNTTGNANSYEQAMAIYDWGSKERDTILETKSREYNRDDYGNIARMFPNYKIDDDKELEPIDRGMDRIVNEFFDQVVWNTNMDNLGSGYDSGGNPLAYGATLGALYDVAEDAYGDKYTASELRTRIDKKILTVLRDSTDIREGKIVLNQLLQLTDLEDVDEFKKLTGLTDEDIREGVASKALDAYARYERDKGDTPEDAKAKRELLSSELSQIKNLYSAKIMKGILDRKEDSKASLGENNTTGDLANMLTFINDHPEIVREGRDGSVTLDSHYDDNVKLAMSQAKRILETVPGISLNTFREGAAVIGTDESGNRYRLTGNKKLIELQQEISGEWKSIARREYTNTDMTNWVKLDASGNVVTSQTTGDANQLRGSVPFGGVTGEPAENETPEQKAMREMEERNRKLTPPPRDRTR